jgi:hypothetical protein
MARRLSRDEDRRRTAWLRPRQVRQPNDDVLISHLDTWVRDVAPNTSYQLQRTVE